jgi:hypothetical protein
MHFIAASLGQVYKGHLKETGDLVAVKVQRSVVLETVTIDLFIIRNLVLVLRRFPQGYIFIYLRSIGGDYLCYMNWNIAGCCQSLLMLLAGR